MDRILEFELMDELIGLKAERGHFLEERIGHAPVERYASEDEFAAELAQIFRRRPHLAAHTSELAKPGDFRRVELAGRPVLLTRGKDGAARAFLNVCRHRGAQLVSETEGCRHRFTCPYHAWTYASSGKLISAPHFASGFPEAEKSALGLTALPTYEAMGFVWVVPSPDHLPGNPAGGPFDFEGYFAPIAAEVEALDLADHVALADDRITVAANWKIIVEGGIEAYHFKIAHRDTIAPYFEDNLSSFQTLGVHMRSILPRVSLAKLADTPRETWRLRDHANILYSLFPTAQLLVQPDHVVLIAANPVAANRTELRIATLVPSQKAHDTELWMRNHAITRTTLDEDFALGEGIQSGLSSGANTSLIFGRFEGALTAFNASVADTIAAAR
ncbi:MAG: SRPBCC family protein [Pseudomonadota bacterium]